MEQPEPDDGPLHRGYLYPDHHFDVLAPAFGRLSTCRCEMDGRSYGLLTDALGEAAKEDPDTVTDWEVPFEVAFTGRVYRRPFWEVVKCHLRFLFLPTPYSNHPDPRIGFWQAEVRRIVSVRRFRP